MLGPIFLRELATVPRRAGHYPSRLALVGLLGVLGATAWQATVGFTRDATLGETARFGLLLFQIVSFVLLVLLIFFSALSAASAVAQEKDRRTFLLLLITEMRDGEIVVGKLLGALLPIVTLLLAGIPVLSLLLLLGGVSPEQVLEAAAVLATTGLAAGSVGGLVALWRDRTFQALALAVLAIALYLAGVQAVTAVGPRLTGAVDWGTVRSWLDPFAALREVLDPPPGGWPGLPPAYGFALVMLGLSAALNAVGLVKLRKWNPSGEPVMQREGPGDDPEADLSPDELKQFRAKAHAAPGRLRAVTGNPILWRETHTLAYGRRPLLIKFAYGLVMALVLYFAVSTVYAPGGRPPFAAAYGLVPAAVLSLLLVAAQAATSITSERDGGALDVLLVTDVSPREFVFGKLLGVVWNTKEYLIPPLLLAGYYGRRGATDPHPGRPVRNRAAGHQLRPAAGRVRHPGYPVWVCAGARAARVAAAGEQPAGHRQHPGHGVLPERRHADLHLPDRHQPRQFCEPVAVVHRLPGRRHRRPAVRPECRPAQPGPDPRGGALPAGHVLRRHQHPDRQAGHRRKRRPVRAVPGPGRGVRVRHCRHAGAAAQRVRRGPRPDHRRQRGVTVTLLLALALTASPPGFPDAAHAGGSLRHVHGVPVVTVAGTPEQMGEQFGVLAVKNAPALDKLFADFLKDAGIKSRQFAEMAAKRFVPAIPPHLQAEIEAAAKASGRPSDLGYFANCVYDLSTGMGCSTVVVEPRRSVTGGPVFGRNFDWLPTAGIMDHTLLAAFMPAGKRAFVTVTVTPIVGCISGMNNAGLVLTLNEIHLDQSKRPAKFAWDGVPTMLLFRRVLEECGTVAEAAELLRNSKRTTTACMTICDVTGGAVFEITPEGVEVRRPNNDICLCTNHLLTTPLAKGEPCWRYDELCGLQKHTLKLGPADVQAALHRVNQGRHTLQSMVFEPREKRLHLKLGDLKQSATAFEAKTFDVGELLK